MSNKLAEFQQRIGYVFGGELLLKQALTHSSVNGQAHYQRLEFLGDRVLGLAVSQMLFQMFPDASEGELSLRHTALVRAECLSDIAAHWDVAAVAQVGRGELTEGGLNPSISADMVEAVLGAILIDGGYARAADVVEKFWQHLVPLNDGRDAKTALQEMLQAAKMPIPIYEVIETSGPAHAPQFKVRVQTNMGSAEGQGSSKQAASLAAATAVNGEPEREYVMVKKSAPQAVKKTAQPAAKITAAKSVEKLVANSTQTCGIVAVVGAPNVGKSSLMNALIGKRVGIVSNKPNTTRLVVRGVIEHGAAQVIFVDTPGLNTGKSGLERLLVQQARGALEDADVVLLVVDAARGFDGAAKDIIRAFEGKKGQQKIALVLNKIDRVQPRSKLLELMTEAQKLGMFADVFAVSAAAGGTPTEGGKHGLADLVPRLAKLMPRGPWLFGAGQGTDMPLALRLAELTREQAMVHLREELPYSVAVIPEQMAEVEGVLVVNQRVLVARETHKGMVVGKGGQMLKTIGSDARAAMQQILGRGVRLELVVRVEENWASRAGLLAEMGLG